MGIIIFKYFGKAQIYFVFLGLQNDSCHHLENGVFFKTKKDTPAEMSFYKLYFKSLLQPKLLSK